MRYSVVCLVSFMLPASLQAKTEVHLEQTDEGVIVRVDDSLFAKYLTRSGRQPVVWPIIGPTGKAYTRSFPVGPQQEFEKADHPHHRSLWFAHGDVNGLDFWAGVHGKQPCEILHRQFIRSESSGATATVVTRNDWVESGTKQCEDERTLVFGADESVRWIDFSIKLIASPGEVTFGDTKEGTFAVRVAGSMKVDPPGQGKILNSLGQEDKAAWGQAADWVNYSGPVEGETVGIAILSHPGNFRHPTKWHVRTYGLFTANPFGETDFPPGEPNQGEFVIPAGEHLTLRYLVLFHRGDQNTADLRERYQAFAESSDPAGG